MQFLIAPCVFVRLLIVLLIAIDCSKGEKLERCGKYLLVRSDPQVIWDTPKTERGWKHMNGHYHRSKKVLNLFAYTGGATLTAASSGLSDKPIGSLL